MSIHDTNGQDTKSNQEREKGKDRWALHKQCDGISKQLPMNTLRSMLCKEIKTTLFIWRLKIPIPHRHWRWIINFLSGNPTSSKTLKAYEVDESKTLLSEHFIWLLFRTFQTLFAVAPPVIANGVSVEKKSQIRQFADSIHSGQTQITEMTFQTTFVFKNFANLFFIFVVFISLILSAYLLKVAYYIPSLLRFGLNKKSVSYLNPRSTLSGRNNKMFGVCCHRISCELRLFQQNPFEATIHFILLYVHLYLIIEEISYETSHISLVFLAQQFKQTYLHFTHSSIFVQCLAQATWFFDCSLSQQLSIYSCTCVKNWPHEFSICESMHGEEPFSLSSCTTELVLACVQGQIRFCLATVHRLFIHHCSIVNVDFPMIKLVDNDRLLKRINCNFDLE